MNKFPHCFTWNEPTPKETDRRFIELSNEIAEPQSNGSSVSLVRGETLIDVLDFVLYLILRCPQRFQEEKYPFIRFIFVASQI